MYCFECGVGWKFGLGGMQVEKRKMSYVRYQTCLQEVDVEPNLCAIVELLNYIQGHASIVQMMDKAIQQKNRYPVDYDLSTR